ncbi:hypothetical protein [Thioclava indica]|uniref:Uncharacterized protein n=1 Tax=Thioclava indica TaxID=1353528 RepID=A0A074JXH8_9RHOB|nr:hypothetical protein [Thioclava indica]KEO60288.1 hypothetical protein DT23_13195 [Thioclava indica]
MRVPNIIPSGNTHRIILSSPDQRTPDIDRIQDIAADATGALRAALQSVSELSEGVAEDIATELTALERRLELRDTIRDGARAEITLCIDRLEAFLPDETVEAFRDALTRALTLSQRVADLIAAEQDLRRIRWGGR